VESNKNIENIPLDSENNIDIKAIIQKYIQYWKYFVLSVVIFVGATFFFNRYSNLIYKAKTAVLLKDDNKSKSASNEFIQSLSIFNSKTNIYNEIEVIKSFDLINQVVKELNYNVKYFRYTEKTNRELEMYKESPFVVVMDTSRYQLVNMPFAIKILSDDKYELTVKAKDQATLYDYRTDSVISSKINVSELKKTCFFGEPVKNENFSFKILLTSKLNSIPKTFGNEFYFLLNNPINETENFITNLAVKNISKDASVIEIEYSSNLDSKSIDFVNALTNIYIKRGLEEKNKTAVKTIEFIDSQLADITDSLNSAENNLQNFRTENNIMDITTQSALVYDKLSDIDKEKAVQNIKAKYYIYLLDYLDRNQDFKDVISPSSLGIEDVTLASQIKTLNELYAEKSLLSVSSTDKNPYYSAINEQISTARKALRETVQNIVNISKISLTDIKSRESELTGDILKLPKTERELIGMQRTYKINNDIYTYLLEKRAESEIAKASSLSDRQVLYIARKAELIYPNKKLNYIIGLLLGLLLPIAFFFLKDYFNTKIKDKKDIESATTLPLVGIIAHKKFESNLVVVEDRKSIVTETLRSIRTNLKFFAVEKEKKTILVTSTIPGEGKTFCAMNLACIIAISGKKTLLVGMDLRKPRISQDFSLNNDLGITTYLIGKAPFEKIVQTNGVENLHIITAGPVPPNPAEILETEHLREFFEKAKSIYDYIIIDTPPVGLVSDALHIMKYVDLCLYVVRQNFSQKRFIDYLNEISKTTSFPNLGIVMNDVKIEKSRYGYGNYNYGYGSGYYNDMEENENMINKVIDKIKK
jgi:tyrosine-protein kinase Etk/Wzc